MEGSREIKKESLEPFLMPEITNDFGEFYAVWDNQKENCIRQNCRKAVSIQKTQKQESCFVKESQSTAPEKHDDAIRKGMNEDEQEMEPF